jgi:hypothetical protein
MNKTLPLLLLLVMTIFVTTAEAQEWQTYKHEFSDRTVYVEVSEGLVLVWGKFGPDQCVLYPNVSEFKGNEIHFPGGTVWTIEPIKEGILIEFPGGKNVTYRLTVEDPAQICNIKRGRKL